MNGAAHPNLQAVSITIVLQLSARLDCGVCNNAVQHRCHLTYICPAPLLGLCLQAMYEDVRSQLTQATELSAPLSKAALQALMDNGSRGRRQQGGVRPRVRMFVSLDFEWWEKSSETILEVGWSLWDTATQRHRTRHWIIRENLNKVSAGGRRLAWALRLLM